MSRTDAAIKLAGAAPYGPDLDAPSMLWGALVLAPVAHARIRSIDLDPARRIPGVIAAGPDEVARLFPKPADPERPVFPVDDVVYRGQPVAAVAAPTRAAARAAARAVRLDLEPLPIVGDLDAVAAEGSAPDPAFTNVHVHARTGDVEGAFAAAPLVVEETYRTAGIAQVAIEPHACLVTPEGGGFHVHTTTQSPFGVRDDLAAVLGLPEPSIRVEGTWVGGGFGGKAAALIEPYAVVLAAVADAPVKLTLTYREEFLLGRSTLPARVRIASAVDGQRIVGRRVELVLDTGASLPGRDFATGYAIGFLVGPYRIPNVELEGWGVRTHKPPFGPHRAPFASQCAFIAESHMDEIARRSGVDPIDLRLDHALREGDTTVLGQPVGPFGLVAALERARERRARWRTPGVDGHGIGVGCGFWSTMTGAGGEAVVRIADDGVTIVEVEREIGSGSVIGGLAAVAARTLGLPVAAVRVEPGDTVTAPYDAGVYGSRTVGALGRAVAEAAESLRATLERRWGAGAGRLTLGVRSGRLVAVRGPDERPVGSLLTPAERAAGGLAATGRHTGRSGSIDERRVVTGAFYAYTDFTAAVQLAEVDVDRATGQVRVVRVAAFHDTGVTVDPAGARAQVEGGVAMGLGTALTEETLWAADGRLLNPGLLDYRIPTQAEVPPIEVDLIEGFAGAGPFGAKGMGEPPIIPTAAAVANAVADATGVRIHELPLTAERVARALMPP